ncbi:MAG TPA: hypothetical protein VLE73_06370 [Candidatus Saccharimonadales bacterium]|nr:hypothetical protein [Candidatus Saccharimonadales bacterium]
MQFVENIIKKGFKISPKQLVLAGVFTLALASSVALGVTSRHNTSAAASRDCDTNSIDYANYGGGCGAADAQELVTDIRHNVPSDLQTVYAHFGLASTDYDKFATQAMAGTLYRDGHIVVAGQTVATSAWTMGREKFNAQREPITVGGKTYYHSATQDAFASGVQSLPVMVWFDANGTVKTAVVSACGNPVTKINKVVPKADCTALVSTQPDKVNKPNTYTFTAAGAFAGNATFSRVVYSFSDDNTTITKTSLTEPVTHVFKADGTVTATIFAKVPGGGEMQAATVTFCKKNIKYVPPVFVCTSLVAVPIDQQQRSFRFTVKTSMDATTTVKSVDFTIDGKTDTNVTTKDNQGNVFKEYTFNDDGSVHTVKATVFFNTTNGVQAVSCVAQVTAKKTPMCTVPGKEHLPSNSPECGYCKPGVPFGSEACAEVLGATLPSTGPTETSMVGLAFGVGMAGFAGHKLYLRRKFGRL